MTSGGAIGRVDIRVRCCRLSARRLARQSLLLTLTDRGSARRMSVPRAGQTHLRDTLEALPPPGAGPPPSPSPSTQPPPAKASRSSRTSISSPPSTSTSTPTTTGSSARSASRRVFSWCVSLAPLREHLAEGAVFRRSATLAASSRYGGSFCIVCSRLLIPPSTSDQVLAHAQLQAVPGPRPYLRLV